MSNAYLDKSIDTKVCRYSCLTRLSDECSVAPILRILFDNVKSS